MKELRPYQNAALLSLWQWLNNPTRLGNPLVVAPVGAGKSLMIADFIKQVHINYPRTRIVILAHVKELLEQNSEELRIQYPDCDYDFYCEGLGRKRLHNDVTFASIQSVAKKVSAFNRCPEIIIVDECHLISHNDSTLYRRFIDAVKAINPNCIVIGFTGSPFRADTGRLDDGDGKIFDGIAYEIPIAWMMEQGYLVRPKMPEMGVTMMNVSGVNVRGGDFIPGQLQTAVDVPEITKQCVHEVMALAGNRKRWFGMTAGVNHCTHTRDYFRECGIDCEMITGDTDPDERKAIIKWFKEEPLSDEPPRCLINVGTMNVGFNAIHIDLLFPMRPTRSPVLYIQYTGRGLRPVYAPGFDLSTKEGRLASIAASSKPNVLFLDFGGIVKELGPIDAIKIHKVHKDKESEGGGAIPFKVCPSCSEICATAQKYCYKCGYDFAAHSVQPEADKKSAILAEDIKPTTHKVIQAFYSKHHKRDDPTGTAPPTMCVEYITMGGSFKEWHCFSHQGFAQQKALRWFIERLPGLTVPQSVDEALLYEDHYPIPTRISVRRDGKYNRIIAYTFDREPGEDDVDESEPESVSWPTVDDFEIPF